MDTSTTQFDRMRTLALMEQPPAHDRQSLGQPSQPPLSDLRRELKHAIHCVRAYTRVLDPEGERILAVREALRPYEARLIRGESVYDLIAAAKEDAHAAMFQPPFHNQVDRIHCGTAVSEMAVSWLLLKAKLREMGIEPGSKEWMAIEADLQKAMLRRDFRRER